MTTRFKPRASMSHEAWATIQVPVAFSTGGEGLSGSRSSEKPIAYQVIENVALAERRVIYRFVPEPMRGGHPRALAPDLPVKYGRGGIADASTDPGSGALTFIVVRILGERERAMGDGPRHAVDKRHLRERATAGLVLPRFHGQLVPGVEGV